MFNALHDRVGRIALGRFLATAAGVAVLVGLGGSALAQNGANAQPDANANAQPAQRPDVQSPFWGGDRYGDPYRRHDRGFIPGEFPTDLAGEVAPARANYVGLTTAYRIALSRLNTATRQLRQDFEYSQEYRDLQRERNQAMAEFEDARRRILDDLRHDEDYVAAGRLRDRLKEQIKYEHRQPEPDHARIQALAQQQLAYARIQSDARAVAMANDSDYQRARERLREVGQRQNDLEANFRFAVRDDENLIALREQVEHLRIAYLAAGAYYDSTVRTANIATDFAYFRMRAITRPGFRPFDPYPYGHGYSFVPRSFVGGHVGVIGVDPATLPPDYFRPGWATLRNTMLTGPELDRVRAGAGQ